MTKEDQLAKAALKDINKIAITLPELVDTSITYWIRHAYTQGQMDVLEKRLKKLNG